MKKLYIPIMSLLVVALFIIATSSRPDQKVLKKDSDCLIYTHQIESDMQAGHYNNAVDASDDALALCPKLEDKPTPTLVRLYLNVVNAYRHSGYYQKSFEIAKEVFEKSEKYLGLNHSLTLETINTLAIAHSDLGHYDESLRLYDVLIKRQTAIYGEADFNSIIAVTNKASILRASERYKEAEEHLLRAYFQVEDGDSETRKIVDSSLASLYASLAYWDKALPRFKDIHTYNARVSGENHPETLTSVLDVARAYSYLGDYDKSEELYLRAINELTRTLGLHHLETMNAKYYLAGLYESARRDKEALELYKEVLLYRLSSEGETSMSTLSVRNNLGLIYIRLKMYVAAREQLIEARQKLEKQQGSASLAVIVNNNLGLLDYENDQFEAALVHYQRAVALGAKELGDAHWSMQTAIWGLAESFLALENTSQALFQYKRLLASVDPLAIVNNDVVDSAKNRVRQLEQEGLAD